MAAVGVCMHVSMATHVVHRLALCPRVPVVCMLLPSTAPRNTPSMYLYGCGPVVDHADHHRNRCSSQTHPSHFHKEPVSPARRYIGLHCLCFHTSIREPPTLFTHLTPHPRASCLSRLDLTDLPSLPGSCLPSPTPSDLPPPTASNLLSLIYEPPNSTPTPTLVPSPSLAPCCLPSSLLAAPCYSPYTLAPSTIPCFV